MRNLNACIRFWVLATFSLFERFRANIYKNKRSKKAKNCHVADAPFASMPADWLIKATRPVLEMPPRPDKRINLLS
jgi:hypothetical protein